MIHLNPLLCEEANHTQLTMVYFGHAKLSTWWNGTESLKCSQLYYIVKGQGKVMCNDETLLIMREGNWYLLPTGTNVRYWCEDYMEEIYFHIKLCDFNHIDLFQNCNGPFTLPIEENITSYLLALLKSNETIDSIRLKSTVLSILLKFVDTYKINFKKNQLSECVANAISFIHNHLSIQTSVDEIVKASYVSKTTLEKHFGRELGVSVHEYMYNNIMFEASQMLIKSSLSIHNVSEQFGFCDQFYFSKCFKQKFGMSPKEYRKSAPM